MKSWCFLLVNRCHVIGTLLKLSLSRAFFIAVVFSGCSYAVGHTYDFDQKQLCEHIEAAQTWRDVVPIIADQVRLLIFCAERVQPTLFDYEYFQHDWDEPLVAAGETKTQFVKLHDKPVAKWETKTQFCRLKEAIEQCDDNTCVGVDTYAGEISTWKERCKERRRQCDQVCRKWLFDRENKPLENGRSEKVGAQPLSKKELLAAANELRWLHEIDTRGMNSFVYYILSSERVARFSRDDARASFCCSLALFINKHLDLYDASLTTISDKSYKAAMPTLDGSYKVVALEAAKGIVYDNTHRFERILNEPLSLATAILGSKYQLKRESFAASMREVITEEAQLAIQRGDRRISPRPVTLMRPSERSADWHPPVSDVEKVWDRLQLIDEVKFVPTFEAKPVASPEGYSLPD